MDKVITGYSFFRRQWSALEKRRGFTLVELLIDLSILAILLVTLIILIDPLKQLSRATDATRKHDINEIKSALDTYYNDHSCYPLELPFGNRWEESGVVYMREVPQDKNCSNNPASCYIYQINTTDTCPQWNILFTKQETANPSSCPLQSFSMSCIPPNYDPSWACGLSGSIDCDYVSSTPVIPSSPSSGGIDGSSTIPLSSPSPQVEACPQTERRYLCSGTPIERCNVVAPGSGTFCSSDCNGACQ